MDADAAFRAGAADLDAGGGLADLHDAAGGKDGRARGNHESLGLGFDPGLPQNGGHEVPRQLAEHGIGNMVHHAGLLS